MTVSRVWRTEGVKLTAKIYLVHVLRAVHRLRIVVLEWPSQNHDEPHQQYVDCTEEKNLCQNAIKFSWTSLILSRVVVKNSARWLPDAARMLSKAPNWGENGQATRTWWVCVGCCCVCVQVVFWVQMRSLPWDFQGPMEPHRWNPVGNNQILIINHRWIVVVALLNYWNWNWRFWSLNFLMNKRLIRKRISQRRQVLHCGWVRYHRDCPLVSVW